MKIPCHMVQDLLPSYVDELCSAKTKVLIGEHLQKCQECDTKYKEMKGELPEEFKTQRPKIFAEEIQPMKKFKRHHVWQLAALVLTIMVVVIAAGVSIVKGSSEGYSKGYTEGTDEGYNTGYAMGADEGYDTGYTEGYIDGTAENPNLLTMKVETFNVGEIFTQLWTMMQKKWGLDNNVRIVLEEERYSFLLTDMRLCLSDGVSLYVMESYRGYAEDSYTIEVRRMVMDALDIVEEAFRFEALVDCVKAFGFEIKEDGNKRDFLFLFDNELMKNESKVSISSDAMREGWIYENGEARKCTEETILEGNGAYYLLNVGTVELNSDAGTENVLSVPIFTQVYIEME